MGGGTAADGVTLPPPLLLLLPLEDASLPSAADANGPAGRRCPKIGGRMLKDSVARLLALLPTSHMNLRSGTRRASADTAAPPSIASSWTRERRHDTTIAPRGGPVEAVRRASETGGRRRVLEFWSSLYVSLFVCA